MVLNDTLYLKERFEWIFFIIEPLELEQYDGVKMWNLAPWAIKNCKSLNVANKEIKKFSKSLPF